MMHLQEALQSAYVDFKPGNTTAIGLVLPQERTKQEKENLEAVIVSLFYHGYSVLLHDEYQGLRIKDDPVHLLLQKEEDKGYYPPFEVVREVMNAEWWKEQ